MRFLIMDAPRQQNLHQYIREFRNYNVTDVVRVCEPTYHGGELQSAGIKLHELPYDDGHSPPKEVLDRWLNLVDDRFFQHQMSASGVHKVNNNASSAKNGSIGGIKNARSSPSSIAVHCVAGLGRAPVLVAIALIEFANMDPVQAVTHIRQHRRGAINTQQLNWLEQYRRSYKTAKANASGSCCAIL